MTSIMGSTNERLAKKKEQIIKENENRIACMSDEFKTNGDESTTVNENVECNGGPPKSEELKLELLKSSTEIQKSLNLDSKKYEALKTGMLNCDAPKLDLKNLDELNSDKEIIESLDLESKKYQEENSDTNNCGTQAANVNKYGKLKTENFNVLHQDTNEDKENTEAHILKENNFEEVTPNTESIEVQNLDTNKSEKFNSNTKNCEALKQESNKCNDSENLKSQTTETAVKKQTNTLINNNDETSQNVQDKDESLKDLLHSNRSDIAEPHRIAESVSRSKIDENNEPNKNTKILNILDENEASINTIDSNKVDETSKIIDSSESRVSSITHNEESTNIVNAVSEDILDVETISVSTNNKNLVMDEPEEKTTNDEDNKLIVDEQLPNSDETSGDTLPKTSTNLKIESPPNSSSATDSVTKLVNVNQGSKPTPTVNELLSVMKKDPVSFSNNLIEIKMVQKRVYNFGYAPLTVIQSFQKFCKRFSTLQGAILNLLSRDNLLKSKYRFMAAKTKFQLMVSQTLRDNDSSLQVAVSSLEMYAKRNQYRNVALAVEELLYSPDDLKTNVMSPKSNTADAACMTIGNPESEYLTVNRNEQLMLEKIASAVYWRLIEPSVMADHSETSAQEHTVYKGMGARAKAAVRNRKQNAQKHKLSALNESPGKTKKQRSPSNKNESTANSSTQDNSQHKRMMLFSPQKKSSETVMSDKSIQRLIELQEKVSKEKQHEPAKVPQNEKELFLHNLSLQP